MYNVTVGIGLRSNPLTALNRNVKIFEKSKSTIVHDVIDSPRCDFKILIVTTNSKALFNYMALTGYTALRLIDPISLKSLGVWSQEDLPKYLNNCGILVKD